MSRLQHVRVSCYRYAVKRGSAETCSCHLSGIRAWPVESPQLRGEEGATRWRQERDPSR